MTAILSRFWSRSGSRLLPIFGFAVVVGCAAGTRPEVAPSQRLSLEIRSLLGAGRPSNEYDRVRVRLQELGPEVDTILITLIEDRRARTEARANALVLLADRRSALALPMLSRALGYDDERLRSAAVLGLNRLAATSGGAIELIRAATRDPSRNVRLNALQSLDIREVATIRTLLERESDPEVRQVALQLVSLAEARGAPLRPDRRGSLRTAGGEDDPQIVFRPVAYDSLTGVSSGDLRLELPAGRDIPLASVALVVGNVVPAFFSPDRSAVLVESEGTIRVVDIESRSIRTLGPGIAPRLIPFTQSFVFLRERSGAGTVDAQQGREVVYDVYQSSFISDGIEPVGRMRVWVRPDRHAGESPARWMVVSDTGEGFVLRGEGVEAFPLRTSVWSSARP